ncbi:phage integrase SAM-like domain-containing protein [uncultured Polaribacter sp.]|uniref:phage integrase SAM-like domain-containing protein n=1 Tax=uncultured Polaribacter sp. TaxID=174711 RepID=UPI0030DC63F6|tara:strand:- start:754 stop:2037 length:1284 start_codon:yes stop_codon:yes gene_type:complete
MATIKFILQGKSQNSQIYLRLSIDKKTSFKRKTGYQIDPKEWSVSTGFPKTNNPSNKNLKVDLKTLETFIETNLNNSNSQGTEITSLWLADCISKHLGREDKNNELNYLIPYTKKFIESLNNSTSASGKKGVSEATIKKRTTILNKLIKYENIHKKKLKVYDVDLDFREKFIVFLDKVEKLSNGTIGKYLKEVKTICFDAQKNGVEVSLKLIHFKGFSSETIKITLSFDEIDEIQNSTFTDINLKASRDWLVIGCFTGQRVSDLLRMNINMIEKIQGFEFIVLNQKKTGKLVQIPIHQKVQEVLEANNGSFPKVFSENEGSNSALFNKYLKEVCKIAGLTKLTKGTLRNKESGRTELGEYPKYKLVSSHICRRSFATNFYALEKYPTPLLMNITAHGTERMFLSYIGKKPIDYGVQLAKIWQNENKT